MVACGGGSGGGSGTTYSLEGTLSGLTADGLELSNGSDTLEVPPNSTSFTMPTAVTENVLYNLIISHEPIGFTCLVSNGSGTMPANVVTDIKIVCTDTGSNSTNTPTTQLTADAGPICEANDSADSPSLTFSCDGTANSGSEAMLNGDRSEILTTPQGTTLSYAWSFVFKPEGSIVAFVGADTPTPSFTPDKAGPYAVQLVVSANDGSHSQRAVTQVISVSNAILNDSYTLHGGLQGNCDQCHVATVPGFRFKTDAHIATSDTCQTCHWPAGFEQIAFVDHKEVFGNCSVCHDGVIATGKSVFHQQTDQECNDCHTTDGFLTLNPDGTFDHSTITSPCSACHNGTTAKGTDSAPNPPGHPSISVECNNCHTTVSFTTPFVDHTSVTPGTCGQSGCHDDASSNTNKNSNPPFDGTRPHPVTGNIVEACDLCHTITSFNLGGEFNHDVLARNPIACDSCHDGQNAIGKDSVINNHPIITSDCAACHNTTSFVIVGGVCSNSTDPNVFGTCFDHTNVTPGSCDTVGCHDGNAASAIRGVPTTGDGVSSSAQVQIHIDAGVQPCDACHMAGGSFSLAKVDHSGFGTIAVPATPPIDCNSCHDGITATGKNVSHIETVEQCSVCHEPQSDTFAGAGFDHASLSIIGNISTPTCVSCHDGSSALAQSVTHVTVPTVGDHDCLVCHHDPAYSSFALTTFNHQDAVIANGNTPITCNSCHDGKSHDGVIVISKPSGHIPTADDCSLCHDNTNNGPGINGTSSSGFTSADPFVNTIHNAYNSGCRTCHNGAFVSAPYLATSYNQSSISSTHATAHSNGWDCNACHTTTGGFAETNPVNHQDPAIKAETCISCHDGNTTGATPKNAGHPNTSDDCQFCHQAGGSFVAGFDHTTLDNGGTNQGLACAICHNGVNATGKGNVPAGKKHIPTTRDCAACHTGYPPTVPTFAGATFDHSGPEMTGKQCMDCHDNKYAIGKSSAHLVTSADCGACHTTKGTFATNATGGFNHTGVVNGCQAFGCHAAGTVGVVDVLDNPNSLPHIPIVSNSGEINCYGCHKNAGGSFANATMNHSVVTFVACADCHDGQHDGSNAAHIVTTKSSSHMITSVTACDDCHKSTSSWSVNARAYNHATNDYPGDHSSRRISRCSQCHNNNPPNENISTFPKAPYGSTCAACHVSDGQREHNMSKTKYWDCGDCHRVSRSGW